MVRPKNIREQSQQPWRKASWLREDFSRQAQNVPSVDEEAGVIRGLKLCGLQSDNGRDYDPECLRAAVPLYEGKPCYVNHCTSQRDVRDDIGVWRNCRFLEGLGIVGDLYYDKDSEDAKRLVYRAKKLHENVGFSHDAKTDPKYIELRGKRPTVVKIEEIKSIDYVAGPATADGLYEDTAVKQTVKSILESQELTGNRKAWLTRLLEDDMAAEPASAEVPNGGGMEAALQAAVNAILADTGIDWSEKAKRIATWIKTHEKMTAKAEPEAPVAEACDDKKVAEMDGENKDDKEKATEARIAKLESELAIARLLEGSTFKPSKEQLADLMEQTDAGKRRRLFDAYAAASKVKATMSKSSHSLKESTADDSARTDKYRKLCLVG